MRIAFLNLCHCEPEIVARVAGKLTEHPDFDMYIHVDAKADSQPFEALLKGNKQVHFIKDRVKVYWGGYHAIEATYRLLREALASDRGYEYFVLLQNLDYPIHCNTYIDRFFTEQAGTEFIRGCKIANTKDWHYARKYKIYNKRDDDFYLKQHSRPMKLLHDGILALRSIPTLFFNGVMKENGEEYFMHYGAAQWAVTRKCAKIFDEFERTHPKINQIMRHIQFPDEEYFHTIVHSTDLKYHCIKYDEPERRWLVNWRNIHYFEYPKTITVFEEKDFDTIMKQEVLFVRKVRAGVSDSLMDKIDCAIREEELYIRQ